MPKLKPISAATLSDYVAGRLDAKAAIRVAILAESDRVVAASIARARDVQRRVRERFQSQRL